MLALGIVFAVLLFLLIAILIAGMFCWCLAKNKPVTHLDRVTRDQVQVVNRLGRGYWGEVWEGILTKPKGQKLNVAVKILREIADLEAEKDFLEEAIILGHLSNKNIIKIHGICLSSSPKMIILEYINGGDLEDYLKTNDNVTNIVLLQIAIDICQACNFLVQKGFIHRDIRAANVLVQLREKGKKFKSAVLADFGLAKDRGTRMEPFTNEHARFPIRYSAPESFEGHFSHASDVYMFGMLLWQIFSYGDIPFKHVPNEYFLPVNFSNGLIPMPLKPENCSDNIYTIMLQCWNRDPESRPSFKQVLADLNTAISNLASVYTLPPIEHCVTNEETYYGETRQNDSGIRISRDYCIQINVTDNHARPNDNSTQSQQTNMTDSHAGYRALPVDPFFTEYQPYQPSPLQDAYSRSMPQPPPVSHMPQRLVTVGILEEPYGDMALQNAIADSFQEQEIYGTGTSYSRKMEGSVLLRIFQTKNVKNDEMVNITVQRDAEWYSGLSLMKRLKNDPAKIFGKLHVQYEGEPGVDAGGLSNEFLGCFLPQILHQCMEEVHSGLVPKRETTTDFLELCGLAVGYSLLHNGPKVNLADYLYQYLACGVNSEFQTISLSCRDIPGSPAFNAVRDFVHTLTGIMGMELDSAESALTDFFGEVSNLEKLAEFGWDIHNEVIEVEHLEDLIQFILQQELVLKRKSQFDAFAHGFRMCRLHEVLEQFPEQMKSVFSPSSLKGEDLLNLFNKNVQLQDESQKRAHMFFQQYLLEGEDRKVLVSQCGELKHVINLVLRFITGHEFVPASGFKNYLGLSFLENSDKFTMPMAQTCFGNLKLPTLHTEYENFMKSFDTAICEGMTFQLA